MKTTRILLIILAAAGVFSTACDDLLADLLKFNSQWYSFEFTVEPDEGPGNVVFETEEFDADVDSVLEANGVMRENISSARLSDAKITILTPGQTFDPVEKVELMLETPSLGETMIAWLDSIPVNDTVIILELTKDDLVDYLLEDSFKVTASGVLNKKVNTKVDLRADIRWLIRGKLDEVTP